LCPTETRDGAGNGRPRARQTYEDAARNEIPDGPRLQSVFLFDGHRIHRRRMIEAIARAQQKIMRGDVADLETAVGTRAVERRRTPGMGIAEIRVPVREIESELRRDIVADAAIDGPREVRRALVAIAIVDAASRNI